MTGKISFDVSGAGTSELSEHSLPGPEVARAWRGWHDIYAFFVSAYHVGDWLIADGLATKA